MFNQQSWKNLLAPFQAPVRRRSTRRILEVDVLEERRVLSTVSISLAQNGAEGGANGFFRLSRSDSTGTLFVNYEVNNSSTATAGADYVSLPGYVSFGEGQPTVDIPVTIEDDDFDENDETVSITLLSGGCGCCCGGGGYTLGSPSTASLTIADNDTTPSVWVDSTANAAEGVSTGYVRLRRDDTDGVLNVAYQIDVSSTASNGMDYAMLSGSVSFADGQPTVDIVVDPTGMYDDQQIEGNETVVINLEAGGGCCCGGGSYTLGSPSSGTVTILDNDVNDPPEFDSAANPDAYTFSVAENSMNGTNVGTAGATDPENDILTYSITAGNGAGAFAIDSATGQITVADDSQLNYEATQQYVLTVQVSDGSLTDTATVTINVTNVNEAPEFDSPENPDPDSYTFSLPENSVYGTNVGTVTASDPDGSALTYSISSGNESGAFAINASTGKITVANPLPLDFEAVQQFFLMLLVSDGALTDFAFCFINLTNVNEAPTVAAVAQQNSIEGRTVNLQVQGNDPDGDALTYTAAGLPDGLTINANTGVISGKLTYTSSGNHNVTVTATDPGGLTGQRAFVWVVADARIGTFSGTEQNAGTNLDNWVTVSGISATTLYICPGNTVELEVAAPTGGHLPLWADTLFSITGAGAAPASGNFNDLDWPVITLTGAAPVYTFKAGVDMNGDGTLQAGEVTHDYWVRVISFTGGVINAQRLAVAPFPAEPGLTPIKATEHFDVLGKFKFELTGGNLGGPNSMIRYQLWDWDGAGAVLNEGWGYNFEKVFPTGAAEGNCKVRFYADANGNETRDGGEIFITSETFWVMQRRVFNMVAEVSDQIPAAFSATVGAIFQTANNMILLKNSANDWRGCVTLNVTVQAFEAGPARPDPCAGAAQRALHYASEADVVFVNTHDAMGSNNGDWHQTIIGYTNNFSGGAFSANLCAGTLAHETGHGVGCAHPVPNDATNGHLIMTSVSTGTYDHLTQAEARNFDSGPLTLAEAPIEDSTAANLTQEELETALAAAQSQWDAYYGASPVDWSQMELILTDLPDSYVGMSSGLSLGNGIWIDWNAAGHGWFIDATPGDNSEFSAVPNKNELLARGGSPAASRVDLLTVLLHEMGHAQGLEHDHADGSNFDPDNERFELQHDNDHDHDVMLATLPLGTRRLPEMEPGGLVEDHAGQSDPLEADHDAGILPAGGESLSVASPVGAVGISDLDGSILFSLLFDLNIGSQGFTPVALDSFRAPTAPTSLNPPTAQPDLGNDAPKSISPVALDVVLIAEGAFTDGPLDAFLAVSLFGQNEDEPWIA